MDGSTDPRPINDAAFPQRLAGQTFAKGDELEIKAGQKKVRLKCLEIKEKSVVLLIEGIPRPQELGLK